MKVDRFWTHPREYAGPWMLVLGCLGLLVFLVVFTIIAANRCESCSQ